MALAVHQLRYRLDGPGLESRDKKEIFSSPKRP